MNPKIKKDVIEILENVLDILKVREKQDVTRMKELSNKIIHNSSVFQDQDSISIGVFVYALSKIIERCYENPKLLPKLDEKILEAKNTFEKGNIEDYRKKMQSLFSSIRNVDKKLGLYIEEVFDKARINRGSKLFAHGISLGRAAHIMNISQWELMSYVGKTQIIDKQPTAINIEKRLKFTRRLFNV